MGIFLCLSFLYCKMESVRMVIGLLGIVSSYLPQYFHGIISRFADTGQLSCPETQLLSIEACRQTWRVGLKKRERERKGRISPLGAARAAGPQLFVDKQECRASGFVLLVCD